MTTTSGTGHGPGQQLPRRSAGYQSMRLLGAGMLTAAGAAHIPVIPSHVSEAPYIGALFILLTTACLGLAALLIWHASPPIYAAAAVITLAAIAAYVLSRTVGLPMIEDDIGNWFEPLGVISVVTETAALLVCAGLMLKTKTVKASAGSHYATQHS